MEDCKCGRIPHCYGGKKFRIHEELEKIPRVAPLSEETAQATIKILEDFSKSLEADLKAYKLINLIYEDMEKSIKNNDMEENKTINEWKEAFAELYKAMRKELGSSDLDVEIFQTEAEPIVNFDIRF